MLRDNGITNFYWQYFQAEGIAEAELERDLMKTFASCLAGADCPTRPLRCS
jgi:hypothetical protein